MTSLYPSGSPGRAIVDRWFDPLHSLEQSCLLFGHYLRNTAVRIAKVTKINGLPLTADNTEGLKTTVDSMDTKVAFLGLLFFRVVKDGIKRAGLNTYLTSIARLLIQDNRPIFSLGKRSERADIHTGWVGAVVAKQGEKTHLQIGKLPFRCVLLVNILCLNPNQGRTGIVFLHTRHTTRLAPYTPFLVDDQAKSLFQSQISSVFKGSLKNNFAELTLRFGLYSESRKLAYLLDAIE